MAGNAPHIPGCRDLSLIGERVARSLFSAVSDRIGRPVTVTVFPPLSEGRTSDGFDRAAATAQRLGAHPSVLTIHEWGHASDGRPWIITDPQPPESVDTLLTMDGPLEVERALKVGVLLAGALETAHRSGIVHGDLSPARLVFGGRGEPLVAETGLAPFAVFPGLGALNNPVRYFSPPEVLERTDIGPSTDVYSLATTVYALLAGRAPQQKPAEVTDSNASLLLRILQMPVPPIDRPDLPVGLEDALRAPLSPNPDRRPQQAIDVAWLLQDVQRRAGFAVTEPVVLDLDDIAGGQQGRGRSLVAPAVAPSIESAAHAASSPFSSAGAETAPAAPPPPPAADGPGPDPWAPEVPDRWGTPEPEPRSDPWTTAAPAALGASPPPFAAPTEAFRDTFPDEDVPPPTIFPFAEGHDARTATGAFGDESLPAASSPPLWPSPDQVGQPADSLWPSSWPATDEPVDELPAWATPPGNGSAESAPDHAVGDDGGSIGDLAELSPPRGPDGPGGASGPPAFDRPAELDELPSWYTDPLPNAGRDGANGASGWSTAAGPPPGGNGNGRPLEAHAFEAPPADGPLGGAPWPFDTTSFDDPRPSDAPGLSDRPDQQRGYATPAGPSGDEALPGSGHDLRSLFGEVVGGEAEDAALPARRPAEERPAPPGFGSRPDPTTDPLGPPLDRPPIDLTQLDAPLGPSPYLPSRDRSPDTDRDPPARLPRRHEVSSWQPPTGQQAEPAASPRLPRATEQRFTPEVGGDDHEPAPRLERAPISQVASAGDRPPRAAPGATGGPPAMPVIVLICVVLVLAAGAAWLVLTGDDAGTPATERPAADGPAGANAPTGLQAFEGPDGAQVSWSGTEGTSFVVTVLSTDQPPQALPPTEGTSALVPAVAGQAGGRCFTVAVADATGTTGSPSDAVCTGGGTVEAMQGS